MNYTENYHLPQWVKEDRIMMDDFNAAMSSIDSGMAANAQTAAELPYVVGTYIGTGEEMDINLGFRPSFLIIGGMSRANAKSDFISTGAFNCLFGGYQELAEFIRFTDTGFQVSRTVGAPELSAANRVYDYIAFR